MVRHSFCRFAALFVAGLAGAFACSAGVYYPTGVASNDTSAIKTAILTSAPGGTIVLGKGTFRLNDTILINNGSSLVGSGWDTVLSLEVGDVTGGEDRAQINALKIAGSPGTVISNLTITTKNTVDSKGNPLGTGSALRMDSGTVDKCLFTGCVTVNGQYNGGGVYMEGGTVRNSTFTQCEARNSSGYISGGEAVYMKDGLVENCVLTNNVITYTCNDNSWMRNGTVLIKGGTLRGCLIADNVNHNVGSGVTAEGGTIENCTIARNRGLQATSSPAGVAVVSKNVTLINNIIWGNTTGPGASKNISFSDSGVESGATVQYNDCQPLLKGAGNIAVDPAFTDAAHGDYHPGYTDCIDGGSNQGWMTSAVDLDGNRRIVFSAVDMGCYERLTGGVKVQVTSDGATDSAKVTLVCKGSSALSSTPAWSLTRQEDGYRLDASGATVTLELGTGTWDVRVSAEMGGQPHSVTIADATAVMASRVYANAANVKGGKFPFASVEDGALSIDRAFPLLAPGGTLYVEEGSYVISNQLSLADGGGTRVESLKGPEKTVVRLADCDSFRQPGYYGVVVSAADAYLEGVTFVAGRPGEFYDGKAYYTGGMLKVKGEGSVVTNCAFRDVQFYGEKNPNNYQGGVGLSLSGGTVSDCLFSRINGYSSGAAYQHGYVVMIEDGLADRIRVDGCYLVAHDFGVGGSGDVVGVYVHGVLRNSLITRCVSDHGVPVYVGVRNSIVGGSIINCTIANNTNQQTKVSNYNHTGGLEVNEGEVVNTIVVDNWSDFGAAVSNLYAKSLTGSDHVTYSLVNDRKNDGVFLAEANHNVNVEPDAVIFRNVERNDYSLANQSPAVDLGMLIDEDWMTAGHDLGGGLRLVRKFPDIGAYEARFLGFMIRFK